MCVCCVLDIVQPVFGPATCFGFSIWAAFRLTRQHYIKLSINEWMNTIINVTIWSNFNLAHVFASLRVGGSVPPIDTQSELREGIRVNAIPLRFNPRNKTQHKTHIIDNTDPQTSKLDVFFFFVYRLHTQLSAITYGLTNISAWLAMFGVFGYSSMISMHSRLQSPNWMTKNCHKNNII